MHPEWIAGFVIGILANLIAELFLALDLSRPVWRLTGHQICLRSLRWVSCLLGCSVTGDLGISIPVMLLFGLFSVSAATDFETSVLPPDGFVYGAVLISMAVGWMLGGWSGLGHVAIAQAFCFSVIVLAVRYLGACDSGDIKLGMQYGAVCGSLFSVMVGGFYFWLIACLVIAVVAVTRVLWARSRRSESRRSESRLAARGVLALQLPLGPLLWCGVLGSLAYKAGWI
jgi:hypothetical protein